MMLWSVCPNNKLCGCSKVLLAVADTVLKFNTGSFSRARLLKSIGCKPKSNSMFALRREDYVRIYHTERKKKKVVWNPGLLVINFELKEWPTRRQSFHT